MNIALSSSFLEDFNPEEYDGAILTGAPVASEPLQQREEGKGVTYFEEYIATLDKIKQSNTPTLAICWASHVALNHFYEVPRHKKRARQTHRRFQRFKSKARA